MLETDPSERKPREYYLQRHRGFALAQVGVALGSYKALVDRHGSEAAEQSLRGAGLRMMLAECMLARDKLQSQLAASREAFRA